MKALANYIIRHNVTPQQQAAALELLTGYLMDDGPHERRAAAQALGALGSLAETALEPLATLAGHDPQQRVRAAAESALTAIREGDADSKEVRRLRNELDDLREQNEELEDRLQKLETK